MSEPVSIIITVNSPGEVSGWLKPFVTALKKETVTTSITVFIPPCTFASGSECEVVRAMPEVDLVVEPGQVWKYMLFGKLPSGFKPAKFGAVLFLGGDLTWTAWIARRLGYPAVAYTEGFANWVKSFFWFAQPYPNMAQKLSVRGIPENKLPLVGNLMLDAVQPALTREEVRKALNLGERPFLLLMPGSRPAHFEYMVPFLLDIVGIVKRDLPETEAVFSISPFVDDTKLRDALQSPNAVLWGKKGDYYPGEVHPNQDGVFGKPALIKTETGLTIPVLRSWQYDLMAAADLAISLPGTNTMELSFMGVPLIITVPLLYPEKIPLEGIPGLIGNIPLIGKPIKKWLITKLSTHEKYKYTAWPNILAQDYVVPELRGRISAAQVSQTVVDLFQNKEKRLSISKRQKEIVGEQGAADRLVRLLEKTLDDSYGNSWRK